MAAVPEGKESPASFCFHSRQPAEDKNAVFQQLREFASRQHWPPAVANEVTLILEEWLTNVITYGFSAVERPEFQVQVFPEKGDLTIRVKDNGIRFDPTLHPPPDFTVPLEERPIGGLGIYMMRKLSAAMEHERKHGWNILKIRKSLHEPVLPSQTGNQREPGNAVE